MQCPEMGDLCEMTHYILLKPMKSKKVKKKEKGL